MLQMHLRRLFGVSIGLFVAAAASVFAAEPDCPPAPTSPTQAQIEAAARTARDRGALWTMERDGRRSWLYATIHVGTLETSVPGPKVAQALRAADTIAIELDLSAPATAQAMVAPQAPAKDSGIPSDLLERLRVQARRACVPWEQVATMPPALIATTLAFVDARRDGYDPRYATELVLSKAARAMNKPVAVARIRRGPAQSAHRRYA